MSLWINVFNRINYLFVRDILLSIKYVYSNGKSLKEGALPTLNLSRPTANANATNNWSKRAIEKREEYALLQEQIPQLPPPSAYISFEELKIIHSTDFGILLFKKN